jgi:hypothetical protein
VAPRADNGRAQEAMLQPGEQRTDRPIAHTLPRSAGSPILRLVSGGDEADQNLAAGAPKATRCGGWALSGNRLTSVDTQSRPVVDT